MSDHIYIVVQQGGASTEWYPSTFDTEEEAQAHIDDCYAHTYNCIGPVEMPGEPSEADWIEAIGELMRRATMSRIQFAEPRVEYGSAVEDD